jgi:hypothetical protein
MSGSISSGGTQNYSGPVVLAGSTTVSGSSLTFNSTVDGGFSLTANSGGATSFAGAIGNMTALASITTDAGGTTSLAGNVTTTGAISFNDTTTASGLSFSSTGGGNVLINNATATSPANITTSGNIIFGGTTIGSAGDPVDFLTSTPSGLQLLQVATMFFNSPTIPATLVFPPGSSVTGNGALLAANAAQLQAGQAASAAQTTAASATVQEANETFGTDSVAEQVEYGFAGDVGTTPPMDHRLDETGISVPECLNESREGAPCK